MYWWAAFLAISYLFRLLFLCFEGFAFKFYCIVICKRVLPVNDNFMALFLNLTNTIVGSVIAFVSLYTPPMYQVEMRSTGKPTLLASQTPLKFE